MSDSRSEAVVVKLRIPTFKRGGIDSAQDRFSHRTVTVPPPLGQPRILFLDDDPKRAAAFLVGHPGAVWVQTVHECFGLLEESWDEVHLDHDRGGEVFVDSDRDDCGMAVIRWLSLQPRPHLKATRFFVHTHNPNAACMMVLHLEVMGFNVESLPFGTSPPRPIVPGKTRKPSPLAIRILRWLQGFGNHR